MYFLDVLWLLLYRVTIAMCDATANDIVIPTVNIEGFPTIIFFPANSKASPLTYEGERGTKELAEFVSKHRYLHAY